MFNPRINGSPPAFRNLLITASVLLCVGCAPLDEPAAGDDATSDPATIVDLPNETSAAPSSSAPPAALASLPPVTATPKPKPTPAPTPKPKPKPRPTPKPVAKTDPLFGTCREANDHGYGNYVSGKDPEYSNYQDRDGDGIVCEF